MVEQHSVEQDVARLHNKVAEAVMATINTYWREAEVGDVLLLDIIFETGVHGGGLS